MTTYVYAPAATGYIVQSAPYTPLSGHTLATDWPADMAAGFVDITALSTAPAIGSVYNPSTNTFTAPAAPAPPSAATIAQQLLYAGITVTSTSTPALNGVYACDGSAQSNINAVQTYILTNGKFPKNSSTMVWPDMNENLHTFSSTAEFSSFATAIADVVTAVSQYGLGIISTAPSMSVTIP